MQAKSVTFDEVHIIVMLDDEEHENRHRAQAERNLQVFMKKFKSSPQLLEWKVTWPNWLILVKMLLYKLFIRH